MNILTKYFLSNLPKWTVILALPHLLTMFAIIVHQSNSLDVKFAAAMLCGAHLLFACFVSPLCEKYLIKLSVNILVEKLDSLPDVGNTLSYRGSIGHRRSKRECIDLLIALVIKEKSHIIISHNGHNGMVGLERKEGKMYGPHRIIFYAKAKDAIWVGY